MTQWTPKVGDILRHKVYPFWRGKIVSIAGPVARITCLTTVEGGQGCDSWDTGLKKLLFNYEPIRELKRKPLPMDV